ncbi:MAG: ABC transporter permease [Wenyingzhuangia sp.]
MNKLILMIKREFITKVRSSAYLVLIFLSPLLVIGTFAAVFYFSSQEKIDDDQKVSVLVVTSPEIILELQKKLPNLYLDIESSMSFEAAKLLMYEQNHNGLLYTNPSLSVMKICYDDNIPLAVIENICQKSHIVQQLKQNGVDSKTIKLASASVPIHALKKENPEVTIEKWGKGLIAVGSGYLVMMFVIVYGNAVMRSTIEEKNSRVVEIIVGTVKPFQLMLAKIIGNALAGILQFIIWLVLILVGLTFLELCFPNVGEKTILADQIFRYLWQINYIEIFVSFILFFLSGYFLYSAFYATIGAAVSSETDTQQFVHPILLPLMFAVYIGVFSVVNGDPNGETATLFSMIPFTSPIVMLMRIPYGVPIWQIILSLALLLVSFITTVFIAGKIYSIGILTYGNKPSIRQLVKWMFQ